MAGLVEPPCSCAAAHLQYARLASSRLIEALRVESFAFVVELVREQVEPVWDLRFRGDPCKIETQAALYYSSYGALLIEERRGQLRLRNPSHGDACGFDHAWLQWRPAAAWTQAIDDIGAYLTRVRAYADAGKIRGVDAEGRVQTALCARRHLDLCVVDREANFHAPPSAYAATLAAAQAPAIAAREVLGTNSWRRRLRDIGGEADAVAIDAKGRLLVIEVKPAGEWDAAWAPAQAVTYAAMFEFWLEAIGRPQARAILMAMAQQRTDLDLAVTQSLVDDFPIVPVVAIGAPRNADEARIEKGLCDRIDEVMRNLRAAGARAEVELARVGPGGELLPVGAKEHGGSA